MTIPLPTITALARAGALEQATRLFGEGGYDSRTDDPAALAVKGRLLKDRALIAVGGRRAPLLAEAIAAYSAADAITPQPYLLINVATLNFLGGDPARAAEVAGVVLERLDAPDIAETPYWIAATRAEAQLLRGDQDASSAALAEAMALNPDGWSDHASTLHQFGLICAVAGISTDWLDPHRPPHSLHYAGHLGVAAEDSAALGAAVDVILAEEKIGFGYGALAAGADIIIAEVLIARGAELHVVLPTHKAAFITQSVVPFGSEWLPRFEACIAAATSVRHLTQVEGDYEPLATALGSDVAMGTARLNARMIESSAVQLVVIDDGDSDFGGGAGTARDGVVWQRSGSAQRRIVWPRSAAVPPSSEAREGRADRRLMALLHVGFDGLDARGDAAFCAALDDGISAFWAEAKALNPIVNQPHGNARIYAFVSLVAALSFAHALRKADPDSNCPLTMTGHYGLVHLTDGAVTGPAVATLITISDASLPGTITLGDEFAAALSLRAGGGVRTEYVGDCTLPDGRDMRLFALLG